MDPMPTRYEDFTDPGERPWLDRPGAEAEIDRRVAAGELTADEGAKLHDWCKNGWIIVDADVDHDLLDEHSAEMDAVIERHRGEDPAIWKVELQNMHVGSQCVRKLMVQPGVLAWIDRILGRRAMPYQSLSLPVGSQIPPHADQILMTTYPEGNMVAAWIALETIDDSCGPLTLWSGSHRLPYLSAEVVGLPADGDEAARGAAYNANYYGECQRRIEEHGLEPFRFLPKKGEVLLWHSNVLHAGAPVTGVGKTRRSLVVHYYAEGVHYYSDLFNRTCELPDYLSR
jgi:hypothetical protein